MRKKKEKKACFICVLKYLNRLLNRSMVQSKFALTLGFWDCLGHMLDCVVILWCGGCG